MKEIEEVEEVQVEQKQVPEMNSVDVDRVIFKEVNDDELDFVNRFKSERSIKSYFSKMIASVFVIIIVFGMQCVGDMLQDYEVEYLMKHKGIILSTCKNYIMWMIAAFIIFNAISLFVMFVKRQLVSMTENYYILIDAVVTDKYLGRKIHTEGKGRNKNYVVFACDQGVCNKALEVDRKQYINTSVGDKIVVLKSVTLEGYTLKYLKEDEYRSFYNDRIKNS